MRFLLYNLPQEGIDMYNNFFAKYRKSKIFLKIVALSLTICCTALLTSCNIEDELKKELIGSEDFNTDLTISIDLNGLLPSQNGETPDDTSKNNVSSKKDIKTSSTAADKKDESKITSSRAPLISAAASNKYGNTAGNLNNVGYITEQDGWLYFSADGYICRMKNDGTQLKTLGRYYANNLNVLGEWIYFFDNDRYNVSKIRIDGSGYSVMVKNACLLQAANGWLYYKTKGDGPLYRITTEGKNKQLIIKDNVDCLNVTDSYLYYGSNTKSYRSGLDGSNIVEYDSGSQEMIINGNTKYTSGSLTKSNTDGSNEITLIESDTKDINLDGEWIYYINTLDNYKIYRIKTDGTKNQKVDDANVVVFNIAGDWIYYHKAEYVYHENGFNMRSDGFYLLKKDGTKRIDLNNLR
jgi:non-specific serine/threonine protein kinase